MSKKNIRKIPETILVKIKSLNTNLVVAGCFKIYTKGQLSRGALKHLGVTLSSKKLVIPEEPVLPPKSSGKYSRMNVDGYEVVRKDLPKETLYNSIESPNWGDSYNGTHTVNLPYERYQRDYHGPEYVRVIVEAKNIEPDQDKYLLSFKLDNVLDTKTKDFERKLFKNLNILQENVGKIGVEKSDVSFDDYLDSINISWDILPPGTQEEVLNRLFSNRRPPSKEEKEVTIDRYKFFAKLNPKQHIFGTSGLQRYFGALLEEDLVVFENVEYGNAIYIMFSDWQELSKRSRIELLSGRYGQNFERVAHVSGWKTKVNEIIKEYKERSSTNNQN